MDNDDEPRGHVLTRRDLLGLIGAAGVAFVVGCSDDDTDPSPTREPGTGGTTAISPAASPTAPSGTIPSCVVYPELMEGPFFVDDRLDRSDIRADTSTSAMRQGAPLALTLVVSRVGPGGACEPLPDAHVDVWQCDAAGAYSGVEGGGGDAEAVSADWLRGFQLTDTNGRAQFLTIYPGWYTGRATHIHFKIRTDPGAEAGAEFTSQLFFDDALSDEVHAQPPYAARGAAGRPRNVDDAIFRDSGDQLTLDVRENSDGYEATFEIGIVLGGA